MIFASNPNPKKVYLIGGLQVEFPYQPYGSQFAFMARVISTLNLAQKEGHCHTLLESPSGTAIVLLLVSEIPDHTQFEINNKKQKKKEAPTIYYASKLLLKDQATGCPEFKNAHKVKGHPSLQKGGCNVVRDRRSCKSWTIGKSNMEDITCDAGSVDNEDVLDSLGFGIWGLGLGVGGWGLGLGVKGLRAWGLGLGAWGLGLGAWGLGLGAWGGLGFRV
ncbi:Glutamate receptor 3.2 isoform B [Glycine soja]|uniref:Glutamate receptor 3.2 isoform B n=1 Tax=Glycine soja TaxID=3848 RepID=A0A445HIC2_GLYSO|nr:Glutamate receptor 3.2 isoform B [Glycine soja]